MADSRDHVDDWLAEGTGRVPTVRWAFRTDFPLTAFSLARETGELIAVDDSGGIYRITRRGRIAKLTRFHEPIRAVSWSDDGSCGAIVLGDTVRRIDPKLQVLSTIPVHEPCLNVAVDAYGQYIAVSLADGTNAIYDRHKRKLSQFESVRPLAFLRFAVTEPLLFAAAEYGLLCCYGLNGEKHWEQKLLSNIGSLNVTGSGSTVYIAAYVQGVQVYDGEGDSVGSYLLHGTLNRSAVSYESGRLIVSSFEQELYWLDDDGQVLWSAQADDEIVSLACDPMGEWAICGFASGRIIRLDWGD